MHTVQDRYRRFCYVNANFLFALTDSVLYVDLYSFFESFLQLTLFNLFKPWFNILFCFACPYLFL